MGVLAVEPADGCGLMVVLLRTSSWACVHQVVLHHFLSDLASLVEVDHFEALDVVLYLAHCLC